MIVASGDGDRLSTNTTLAGASSDLGASTIASAPHSTVNNFHLGDVLLLTDFTDTRHSHKKLQEGNLVRKANCQAVIDDLKNGNAREKSIAAYIKKEYL